LPAFQDVPAVPGIQRTLKASRILGMLKVTDILATPTVPAILDILKDSDI
jgi:hypothetical protein